MKATYADNLTIDRKNNNRGYCKSNCRWIPQGRQNRNRRGNVVINTPWGKMCVAEAAERAGIKQATLHMRLRYGWKKDLFVHPDFIQQWPRVIRK